MDSSLEHEHRFTEQEHEHEKTPRQNNAPMLPVCRTWYLGNFVDSSGMIAIGLGNTSACFVHGGQIPIIRRPALLEQLGALLAGNRLAWVDVHRYLGRYLDSSTR
jgi:hypothetical protein